MDNEGLSAQQQTVQQGDPAGPWQGTSYPPEKYQPGPPVMNGYPPSTGQPPDQPGNYMYIPGNYSGLPPPGVFYPPPVPVPAGNYYSTANQPSPIAHLAFPPPVASQGAGYYANNLMPPSDFLHATAAIPLSNEDEIVKESKQEFESVICDQKDRRNLHGIAIVLAVGDTHVDLHEIGETFQNLGYGVWKVSNPTKRKIASIVHICTSSQPTHEYMTATWCKAVIFYFAGHGGNIHGQKYVIASNKDGEKNTRCYIDSQIVEPFNAPHLSSRYRLFFFDCCLTDTVGNPPSTVPTPFYSTPSSLPPSGQCLVAYATSLHYKSSGHSKSGGVWTHKLLENIQKYDLPISVVLDMTYENVAHEEGHENSSSRNVQGPHYVSSVGLFYLRDPSRNSKEKQSMAAINAAVIASENDTINIEDIINTAPDSEDFTKALSVIMENPMEWKDKFGKRLLKKFKMNEFLLQTTTSVRFMADLLHNEYHYPTWADIIDALEHPTKVKQRTNGKEIIVSDVVKEYLKQESVFVKYKNKV